MGAWREDAARFEELGDVLELARSRTVLAGILRAGGDPAAARVQGDLARAAAHALGAQPLLDELRAVGSAAVRDDPVAAPLTAREREILALVAEGRSNGEIGRLLFISTKTVSVHVSHILGKLGAAGRTEAAAIARRARPARPEPSRRRWAATNGPSRRRWADTTNRPQSAQIRAIMAATKSAGGLMGRLVYSAIASLDGYVADANGDFDWCARRGGARVRQRPRARRSARSCSAAGCTTSSRSGTPSTPGRTRCRRCGTSPQIWRATDKVVHSRTLDRGHHRAHAAGA